MKLPANILLTSAKLMAAMLVITATTSAKAALVFDNISANSPTNVTATSSTPNSFMGDGYVLAAGTTSITGFDLYPVNLTGTAYTGLKINIFVWGGVNLGAVGVGSPAFSSLLGSYSFTSAGTYSSGFYYNFESGTPGVTPGLTLGTPLAISSTTIGLTINVQGTTDGVNYVTANNLSSIITYGSPATVGSALFNGYYRNAAGESDGNFTSTLRSLGLQNQSLALRVYGDVVAVPEPTALALLSIGALALATSRRKRTA